MPAYSVETKLSSEEAVEQARAYFGEGGLGLDAKDEGPCCTAFEGGGGFVRVTADAGDKRTTIHLETREWDYHVKRFMREIG